MDAGAGADAGADADADAEGTAGAGAGAGAGAAEDGADGTVLEVDTGAEVDVEVALAGDAETAAGLSSMGTSWEAVRMRLNDASASALAGGG